MTIQAADLFFGSTRNSGERCANLEEEVILIAEAISDAPEDFDLVVDALQQAGMQRVATVADDPLDLGG